MPEANAIWKLTIDPRGKTDPHADSLAFCRRNGIVGAGWGFEEPPRRKTDVRTRYYAEHGKRFSSALNILVSRMSVGDYVWVYGVGAYFLCRVTSDWWYRDGGEWDAHDIHNGRDAEWVEVAAHLVPGIVKRKMTMWGTAQLISKDLGWREYSEYLFNTFRLGHRGQVSPDITRIQQNLSQSPASLVFEILDEDETEDVVGIYLQEMHGWRLIKSSAYRAQRDFECEMTRARNSRQELAVMQVKSGRTVTLNTEDYRKVASDGTQVYLFSTAMPAYAGPGIENIVCLPKNEIERFVMRNMELLPPPALLRMDVMMKSDDRIAQHIHGDAGRTKRG